MRILHVAMGMPEFDRAWKQAGHEAERIEWFKSANLHADLIAKAKSFLPDVIFCQLQTPNAIKKKTLDALRKEGIFTINWTGDVREDIDWYIDLAPHFGVTLFTNQTDVDTLANFELRSDYLQIGYDETIYQYAKKDRSGVVFLGNDYVDRFPESTTRKRIVEHYKQKGLKAYGRGFGSRITSTEVEVATYQNASFSLNIDHFNRPKFASDRVLRAQACGALICQMSDIELDEHPFALYGYPQMKGMPESYHRMAAEYTREHHTWHSRVPQIIQIVDKWAKGI